MSRTRQMVLLSACLLIGLLLGSLLPSRVGQWLGRARASERELSAMVGWIPPSAHLTLMDDEDLAYVPIVVDAQMGRGIGP